MTSTLSGTVGIQRQIRRKTVHFCFLYKFTFFQLNKFFYRVTFSAIACAGGGGGGRREGLRSHPLHPLHAYALDKVFLHLQVQYHMEQNLIAIAKATLQYNVPHCIRERQGSSSHSKLLIHAKYYIYIPLTSEDLPHETGL